MGQLFGDLVVDRVIHYFDVATPLNIATTVTDEAIMQATLQFILASIDPLNPKIPKKYYGNILQLQLTGLGAQIYYWKIGTDIVSLEAPPAVTVLIAESDTNDFLFTIAVRPDLIRKPINIIGEKQLEIIFQSSFNANALWEK